MHDYEGALWADHRARWADDLRTLARAIAETFAQLHAHQFDAPWRKPERERSVGRG